MRLMGLGHSYCNKEGGHDAAQEEEEEKVEEEEEQEAEEEGEIEEGGDHGPLPSAFPAGCPCTKPRSSALYQPGRLPSKASGPGPATWTIPWRLCSLA